MNKNIKILLVIAISVLIITLIVLCSIAGVRNYNEKYYSSKYSSTQSTEVIDMYTDENLINQAGADD